MKTRNTLFMAMVFASSIAGAADKNSSANTPYLDWSKVPAPVATGKINTAQIAGLSNSLSQQDSELDPVKVMVFISFSMPEESLAKLFNDALPVRNKVTFVLRGTDQTGSVTKTAQRVQKLKEGFDVHIHIDPDKYERFGVDTVPAFVAYKDDSVVMQQCLKDGIDPSTVEDEFIGVYGDVSLEYALDYLVQQNKVPELASNLGETVAALLNKRVGE